MSQNKVLNNRSSEITVQSILSMPREIPYNEKVILLCYILDVTQANLIVHSERVISTEEYEMIMEVFEKRISGIPLAYITGKREFFGLTYAVNQDVLIPRPETEVMVELVIDLVTEKSFSSLKFIDVGTGSGNVIITLAHQIRLLQKNGSFLGLDISKDALVMARKNAQEHKLVDEITFTHSDLLSSPLVMEDQLTKMQTLVVTANLPYVDRSRKEHLSTQAYASELQFEPQIALWADDGGLFLCKKLIDQICGLKKHHSTCAIYCFLEIDPSQKLPLLDYLTSRELITHVQFHKDLAEHTRVCRFKI